MEQNHVLNNSISLVANPKNFHKAKSFLKKSLEGVRERLKDETVLFLALDELYANVMMYAYKNLQKKKMIYISLEETDEASGIVLTVKDNGIPFNPLHKADPNDLDASAQDRKIGGLGIYIIKNTADETEYFYENGQNIMKLKYFYNS